MRWFVCAFVTLAGCSSSSGSGSAGDVSSCSMRLEWGVGPGGGFTWLRDGNAAPMTEANGSCFIDSSLRLSDTTATEVVAETTVSVDGYEPVYQPPARLPLVAGPDGARYATGLRASLDNAAPSDLAGRAVTIVVHATADGCSSWTASDVLIAR